MKFKVGDKVRVIKREPSVGEEKGGLEMEGVISEIGTTNDWVLVESDLFSTRYKRWYFQTSHLELINDVTLKSSQNKWNTVCSRCGAPAYMGLFSIECSNNCKGE